MRGRKSQVEAPFQVSVLLTLLPDVIACVFGLLWLSLLLGSPSFFIRYL